MPVIVNLPPIPLGDDVVIPFALTKPDGTAFDLTGGHVTFGLKSFPLVVPSVSLSKTDLNGGISITDALNGLGQVTLTAADTATGVPAGQYKFDLQGANSAGKKSTQVIGVVELLDHPSR